ncbi:MAG: TIGR02281 family clan AA aspartic protease [Capsulimonas sp.]|uniref:TIGR02281 family clan AA aspartic protease n=1 Tax=Capsulimonas sp. TaxID=2494211 RepID=UPI00326647E9
MKLDYRMPCRMCVAALLLSSITAAHAGQASPGVLAVIPFTLTKGHIYVAVRVNGRPATFVVDTGSGADIVDTASASRLGLPSAPKGDSAVVTGGGGTARAYPVTLSTLQVGGVRVQNSPAFLLNVSRSVKCDGLLGYGFLRNYVVTFDFNSHTIVLRRPGAAPPGQWSLPFVLSGGAPTVVGQAGGWIGRFVVDTGYGGTVILNAPFVAKYHLRDRYAHSGQAATGRGVGGATQSDWIQLDSFQLGTAAVDGVVAEMSRQTQGSFADAKTAGVVGTGVLERFTITFDYPGSRIILTANGVRL